jgi:UDP-sulfoquinovose synthase
LKLEVHNRENPRQEAEEHYDKPDHQNLLDLGYQPTHDVEAEMKIMLTDLIKCRDRIESKKAALIPEIRWDGTHQKVGYLKTAEVSA